MAESTHWSFPGFDGNRHAVSWQAGSPRYVALLSHGFAEHIGRYGHVADSLAAAGAAVYGLDHTGHGRSEGSHARVSDFDGVVSDLHEVDLRAREQNPGLPVVLIGHSMGGLVALRYAQKHGDTLAALVLSGPQVGNLDMLLGLLQLPAIPEMTIDTSLLSRDPVVGADYAADPLVWHGAIERATLEAMVQAQKALATYGELSGLPVLWLHGADDQLIPVDVARVVVERLGGSLLQQKQYEAARHEIFNETNKDEVLADVTTFVDRIVNGASRTSRAHHTRGRPSPDGGVEEI